MKNNLALAKFRFLIYESKNGFVGICYETGHVDVWPTLEETKKHLLNGVAATIKTIADGNLSEKALNRSPSLRYRTMFFIVPLLLMFKRSSTIAFSREPINPFSFANA